MTPALWYVVGYSVVVGAFMLAWWGFALARGLVPEVKEGSREIWFHVAAETATGLTLVAGGLATLAAPEAAWSALVSAAGLGLVTYSLIASPGYYVERRDRAMVTMFAVIWIFTIPAIVLRFV